MNAISRKVFKTQTFIPSTCYVSVSGRGNVCVCVCVCVCVISVFPYTLAYSLPISFSHSPFISAVLHHDWMRMCLTCTFTASCYGTRLSWMLVLEGRKEMFYLTTRSTHFVYGYMASYIWLRTILIVRKETRCRHIGYSFRLTARVILYAPSHRQDSTFHGLCYTSCGALAGTRNSSMGSPHEGSIR